jgi:hypothetical protein
VTPTDRVSDVLARDETLVEVFVRHAAHFEKLRNAAMRRVMARLVTVEQAARIAAVPVDRLVRDLNEALHIDVRPAAAAAYDSAARPAPGESHRPASLREIELDLREAMRSGREPFSRIMAAVAALGPSEVLRLRTIFEPVPLFGLMAKRGFLHEAERHAADDWSVWLWKHEPEARPNESGGGDAANAGAAAWRASSVVSAPSAAVTAQPPTVWLDVRGLEPPEPLVRTLAALEALPAGHQLVQINVRVPQLLLPMLSERGFACEVDDSDADRVRVRIWRASAG